MRELTQFAEQNDFTEGTNNLQGCLGLVFGGMIKESDLVFFAKQMPKMTPGLSDIIRHYQTEPPKVNFVGVTSFLNGPVWGIDHEKPAEGWPEIFNLGDGENPFQRVDPGKGDVKVYNASGLVDLTREYLEKYPIRPGDLVFEAHKELEIKDPKDEEEKDRDKPRHFYVALAIAKPKDPDQNYLLMEDAGRINWGEDIGTIRESLALSVLGCELVENMMKKIGEAKQTRYEEIYLVILDKVVKGAGWGQIQMIYCAPPRRALGYM